MRFPAASVRRPPLRLVGPALLVLLLCQSGCTSALSTALLRDMPWAGIEHAAESEPAAESGGDAAESTVSTADVEPPPTAAESAAARAAAVEEAMHRLAGIATLDAATEAALVDILRGTPREDWPVVIEEFTASLAASATAAVPVVAASPPAPEPAAVASAEEPTPQASASTPEPAVPATPAPAGAEAVTVDDAAAAAPQAVVAPAPPVAVAVEPSRPEPPPPAHLAIRNACFASRVRGWGDVDRFADARFRPGQELIVYFELDNLTATESAAGHTTRIDTSLRLVDADGDVVHAWSFDPITETCAGRRRDYFARYVVRIPESLGPGDGRVELAVTDASARVTAAASLPCEIAGD